jgi:hypothetical protein
MGEESEIVLDESRNFITLITFIRVEECSVSKALRNAMRILLEGNVWAALTAKPTPPR